MLSLNILEKHETDLNKTNSTIEYSPSERVGTIINDDVLKKIKMQIDEEVTKILNGHYETREVNEEQDEMGMGGMMRGGPQGGFPGNQTRPYSSNMEAFRARITIFGFFLLNMTGLLFLRRLSYRISK